VNKCVIIKEGTGLPVGGIYEYEEDSGWIKSKIKMYRIKNGIFTHYVPEDFAELLRVHKLKQL
jgi:hypothetical protein